MSKSEGFTNGFSPQGEGVFGKKGAEPLVGTALFYIAEDVLAEQDMSKSEGFTNGFFSAGRGSVWKKRRRAI